MPPFPAPPPDYEEHLEARDGLQLRCRGWLPAHPPRSVVLIVHGYAEHSGRYGHVAAHLTAHGHAAVGYDQRGFGASGGPPGFIASFKQYLYDLHSVRALVRSRYPASVPVYLFGHSMGGLVVASYVLDYQPDVAGLILSSPLIRTSEPAWLQRLGLLLGRVAPRLPTLKLDRTKIARDPAVVAEARADPLNYQGRIAARTGGELVAAMRRLHGRMAAITWPLLVFHGTADDLTEPAGSRHLYEQAQAEDKTLILYDGLYHETFNEPDYRQEVLDNVTAWLALRTAAHDVA